MTPPRPRIVLDKQIGPEQWDIWKPAASTKELGIWTGHFTGTNHSHRNYFFHYNQSYFIQACIPQGSYPTLQGVTLATLEASLAL